MSGIVKNFLLFAIVLKSLSSANAQHAQNTTVRFEEEQVVTRSFVQTRPSQTDVTVLEEVVSERVGVDEEGEVTVVETETRYEVVEIERPATEYFTVNDDFEQNEKVAALKAAGPTINQYVIHGHTALQDYAVQPIPISVLPEEYGHTIINYVSLGETFYTAENRDNIAAILAGDIINQHEERYR